MARPHLEYSLLEGTHWCSVDIVGFAVYGVKGGF